MAKSARFARNDKGGSFRLFTKPSLLVINRFIFKETKWKIYIKPKSGEEF